MQCCARCERRVFCTDRIIALNRVWHTFCLSCCNCDKLLEPASLKCANGEIYCKCCYKFLFDCRARCEEVCYGTPMPKCSCCCKPNLYCLKPACPKKTCAPCCEPVCCAPKKCAPNPCCSQVCPPVVPRETANYYNRNHRRCKCCPPPECMQPCKQVCSPCTVMEQCPPKICCDSGCDPEPCCNSPRRCIMYPPIKCCEPYPSEIICVSPNADDPPRRCCPASRSCSCAKSTNCCESFCQRCYQSTHLNEYLLQEVSFTTAVLRATAAACS
ncbi:keratin-associated protein 4-3-like isoform X2 [Photinus pyralis]|uniref:keratin-associated protein 4-3-like isoform X2 n=1 Tax=Photinus pyralis TaxID=7054 RepID=UPI0012676C42|nr:keratin-associated protein 4-3-like isoform X2 [Photinus pyralis]